MYEITIITIIFVVILQPLFYILLLLLLRLVERANSCRNVYYDSALKTFINNNNNNSNKNFECLLIKISLLLLYARIERMNIINPVDDYNTE